MENSKSFYCGWLDRTGKLHECRQSEHYEVAKKIIEMSNEQGSNYSLDNPEETLLLLGYIKLIQSDKFKTDPSMDKGKIFFSALSTEQKEWLKKNMPMMPLSQYERSVEIIEKNGTVREDGKSFYCGWLDLNGLLHECRQFEDGIVARRIIEKLKANGVVRSDSTEKSDKILLSLGYVKVVQSDMFLVNSSIDNGYILLPEVELTEQQKQWISENIEYMSKEQSRIFLDYLSK